MGIVVTGSRDKTCIEYTLEGEYLRTLSEKKRVDLVVIGSSGQIVTYSPETFELSSYDVNGILESNIKEIKNCNHLLVTKDSKFVVHSVNNTTILIRSLVAPMDIVHSFEIDSTAKSKIVSLSLVIEEEVEKFLLAGTDDGVLSIIPFNSFNWTKKTTTTTTSE